MLILIISKNTLKFNYKDKSPKIDLPTGNIPKDLYEDKDPASNLTENNFEETNTNTEIKIDIPSFEESMKEENNSPQIEIPIMNLQESNSFDIPTETDSIFNDTNNNMFNEPDIFSNSSPSFTEPTVESPVNFSNEFSTETKNDIYTDSTNIEEPVYNDTLSNQSMEIPTEISFKEEMSAQEQSFIDNSYNSIPVADHNNSFEPPKEEFSFENREVEQPAINTETQETSIFGIENEVNNQNDISLNEVFDEKEIKKEKKSLFGKKKEKTPKAEKVPKEEKTKKEKKSLFGKKNKKTELQNKLDAIAQDSIYDTPGASLFDDMVEQNTQKEEQPEVFNNKPEKEQFFSEPTQTPMFMDLDTSVPSIDNLQTESQNAPIFNNENNITPIMDTDSASNTSPVTDQPSDSIFNNINAPTMENPISDISSDEMEVLRDNAKKKKKNPIVLVLILVAIVAILLVFCVIKLLSPSNDTVVEPPIETPVIDTEVEIDNDTVNSLVEETQQIVDNANDVADTYIENNDLPPQVGVDIDEEILEENTSNKNKTKTFTDTGITFDYPAEWTEITAFNTRETDSNIKNIIMLGLTPLDADDTNNMRVTTEETVKSITSKEYFKNTEELMKKSFTNIKTRKSTELTIAGREAPSRIYTFTDESGNSVEQFQIYVASGKNIYVITFTSSEENFATNLETYKAILKTVQIK